MARALVAAMLASAPYGLQGKARHRAIPSPSRPQSSGSRNGEALALVSVSIWAWPGLAEAIVAGPVIFPMRLMYVRARCARLLRAEWDADLGADDPLIATIVTQEEAMARTEQLTG